MFNGALSALITPFRDGAVDERALREIVEWQIQSGVDGVVACGSTGESATLTHAEHQEGIYKHYKAVAASADLPIIVYNIPGRTGSNILPETFARLCDVKQVVGIKEASGSMDQVSDILRLCGDRLTILSGDDSATLPLMAIGAKGVIATITNVMPREMHELAAAALADDFQ